MSSVSPTRPWTQGLIFISAMRIESQLQRQIDLNKVNRIFREFEWRKVNIIKAGRFPNGVIAVADGQHTCRAIEKKFGDIPVQCEVTDVADDADFRRLVDDCNGPISTKPTRSDRFWMDTAIGAEYAAEIRAEAKNGGLAVVRIANNVHEIHCIDALVRLHQSGGAPTLRNIFSFYRDAFSGYRAFDYVLEGIHLFLKNCSEDPAFSRDKVIRELRLAVFASLIRQAEQASRADRVTKAKAFARVLKSTYNEQIGRRGKHIKAEIP